MDRKIKEAILSFRIEQAYSKDKILELYLNEIFFGLNAYGIAGAALTYFDKSVTELTIAETAYLAALPKGPNNYHPFRRTEAALERRNWVIDRMVENGFVAREEAEDAKKQPLGVNLRRSGSSLFASDYFAEEVRRQIIEKYGDKSLYEGGLSVRTSLDPQMQISARKALQSALLTYDQRRGFRGPIKQIPVEGDWGVPLAEIPALADVPEWQVAVVLDVAADGVDIGLQPAKEAGGKVVAERARGRIAPDNMEWAYRSATGDRNLRSRRKASSHRVTSSMSKPWKKARAPIVCASCRRYRAASSPWIRIPAACSRSPVASPIPSPSSTAPPQAMRQPGSSFKPFVYAAALDNGYTPASVIHRRTYRRRSRAARSGARRTTVAARPVPRRCVSASRSRET